jgi:hypothetical protein
MAYPVTLSESLAVVGVINPDAYTAGTVYTAAIEMNRVNQLVAIVNIGEITGDGTVNFALQQSATSGGSYTTITDKAMTEIETDGDKQVVISLDASEIGKDKPFVKGNLTTAVAAVDVGVVILGSTARYDPASDFNLGTVAQIIK